MLTDKRKKQIVKSIVGIFIVIGVVLVSGAGVFYFQKSRILQWAIKKVQHKALQEYSLVIQMQNAEIEGLSTLSIQNLSLVPLHKDSLFRAQSMAISIAIFPLLLGRVEIDELKMKDAWLHLVNKQGNRNFDFLFKKKKQSSTITPNLSRFIGKLVNNVLDKCPEEMDIQNFYTTYQKDNNVYRISIPHAIIDDEQLSSAITVGSLHPMVWHFAGSVQPRAHIFKLKWYAPNAKVTIPYLEEHYKMKFNFDTLGLELTQAKRTHGTYQIQGSVAFKNMLLNHPKIASKDLIVPLLSVDSHITIGENYLSLDSTSSIHLGKATVHPYVKYTPFPIKKYELGIHVPNTPAQDLVDAIPTGFFQTLEGIQLKGTFGYKMDFAIDSLKPESLKLNITTTKQNFGIESYGTINLAKMNGDFTYTPYENGHPVRDILVSETNPNFTPLQDISPNLKNAILTSEDYSFYNHKGFNELAIKRAIATNFRAKAYKRGGSTISMQLVKNIFLNRQKTLFRKFEEVILVWLIENNRITSKQRMFEVYLNIIEWGHNVYGIKEAARYYFGKYPSQLSLSESIYLVSIVPKPKRALASFLPDGTLKPYMKGYYSLIGGLMAKRGLTPPDSSGYGYYQMQLREGLRRHLQPQQTIGEVDDTYIDEPNEILNEEESILVEDEL